MSCGDQCIARAASCGRALPRWRADDSRHVRERTNHRKNEKTPARSREEVVSLVFAQNAPGYSGACFNQQRSSATPRPKSRCQAQSMLSECRIGLPIIQRALPLLGKRPSRACACRKKSACGAADGFRLLAGELLRGLFVCPRSFISRKRCLRVAIFFLRAHEPGRIVVQRTKNLAREKFPCCDRLRAVSAGWNTEYGKTRRPINSDNLSVGEAHSRRADALSTHSTCFLNLRMIVFVAPAREGAWRRNPVQCPGFAKAFCRAATPPKRRLMDSDAVACAFILIQGRHSRSRIGASGRKLPTGDSGARKHQRGDDFGREQGNSGATQSAEDDIDASLRSARPCTIYRPEGRARANLQCSSARRRPRGRGA